MVHYLRLAKHLRAVACAALALLSVLCFGAQFELSPTLVCLDPVPAKVGAIDTAEAIRISRELIKASAKDALKEEDTRLSLEDAPRFLLHKDTGILQLSFPSGSTFFSVKGGKMTGAGLHMERNVRQAISREEALVCAQQYKEILGLDGELDEKPYDSGTWYEFNVYPSFGGVRSHYLAASSMLVSKDQGQLMDFTRGSDLKVHGPFRASVSSQQATDAALRDLPRLQRWPTCRATRATLCWMVPGFVRVPNEMDERHLAAREAHEAVLLYEVHLEDCTSLLPDGVHCYRMALAYVDAVTGRTIAIMLTPYGSDSATRDGKVSPKPWSWPQGSSDVVVVDGRKRCAVHLAEVATTPPPEKTAAGKLVGLMWGNEMVTCEFDEAAGLVSVEQAGTRLYGKPNAALLKALRAAKPLSTKPFGKPKPESKAH